MPLDNNDISLIREAIKEEVSSVVDDKLDVIKNRIDAVKADTRVLRDDVEGIATKIGNFDQEQTAHLARMDRHEGWIQKLAGKLGLKLEV